MSAAPRIGALPSGPRGTIADVAGVAVGHCTIASGDLQTGVTVVCPEGQLETVSHSKKQQRRERGVPVVRMHDVRPEVHAPATLQRGARQHQEAAVLIGVTGVQPGAGVQRVRFDQVNRSDGPGQLRLPDVHAVFMPAGGDGQPLQGLHAPGVEAIPPDLRIERHEQADIVSVGRKLA